VLGLSRVTPLAVCLLLLLPLLLMWRLLVVLHALQLLQ
jgi:hypothetical protein